MTIEISQFPCLSDNYGYLVRDKASGAVAAIDTPDAQAINTVLAEKGWRLTHILNTHWHPDHAGGNVALKERWACRIFAPAGEFAKIPGADTPVREGDIVALGETKARVIDTPGHTSGHIIYYFDADNAAFVGDTIFALGCGRLFEGTPEEMWSSLSKVAALPSDTKLYCAHEYTLANARFAVTVDPENAALKKRVCEVEEMRARGEPTVPTTLSEECATNPFLRAEDGGLKHAIGMEGESALAVFAEIRKRKDRF